jgi:Tfp pilus assembly protein PilV
MRQRDRQSGFGRVEIVLIVFVIAALGVTGLVVYQHHKPSNAMNSAATSQTQLTTQPQSTVTQSAQANPYQGWNTYTSAEEKSSFKYPTNWTVTKSVIVPIDTNADSVGIKSPSGAITISWASALSGFGNEYGTSYPLHTVIDKTPISAASGYYVVSGITTLDGKTYYPWLAVQDSKGILASGVNGDLATFTGKHNKNKSTNTVTGILFATCGARTVQNSPSLTKDQATAWFSGSEAQQAKLVLLSFSDQN